jgi:hypothetical protein
VATIISQETTTRALNNENGIAWLGFSISDDVFEGKSAFKLMQLHGVGIFGEQPAASSTLKLSLNGKKVQDSAQAFAQIERRVGRGEVELGSCALCFEEILKTKLVPACGRTGCGQKVDEGCLHEWVSFTFFLWHTTTTYYRTTVWEKRTGQVAESDATCMSILPPQTSNQGAHKI